MPAGMLGQPRLIDGLRKSMLRLQPNTAPNRARRLTSTADAFLRESRSSRRGVRVFSSRDRISNRARSEGRLRLRDRGAPAAASCFTRESHGRAPTADRGRSTRSIEQAREFLALSGCAPNATPSTRGSLAQAVASYRAEIRRGPQPRGGPSRWARSSGSSPADLRPYLIDADGRGSRTPRPLSTVNGRSAGSRPFFALGEPRLARRRASPEVLHSGRAPSA